MRFVEWNCCGGLARKLHILEDLGTDVAVLSEVAQIPPTATLATQSLGWAWTGDINFKGLAVAAFNSEVQPLPQPPDAGRYSLATTLPSRVGVLGIWTCPPEGSPGPHRYGTEALKALTAHGDWLRDGPSIVAGDFHLAPNGSEDTKTGGLREVFSRLEKLGYHSVYHHHTGEEYGNETLPTHFWRRNEAQPFHIDYCFVHDSLLPQVRSVEVGTYADWTAKKGVVTGHSDHVPMIIDFDL